MLMTAVILFAVAAVLGIVLASSHLKGKFPPIAFALVHGILAASGLVILILSVVRAAEAGMGTYSLVFFVIAALGGFVLVSYHLRKRALPVGLIIVHGLMAVVGFVLLLLWTFGTGIQ
jgi:hypothetical protein